MSEHTASIGLHPVRRLRRYLKPNGRIVHIVTSPVELETFRTQLSREQKNDDVDFVIHGSPEHIETLREIHAHNEQKRDALRQRYSDIYSEFEILHTELEAVSTELSKITQNELRLEESFSRYGYSAHIRTREAEPSAESSANSVLSQLDKDSERHQGQSMKFWKKPVIRQYFHKGLIWRASECEEVASFELFVDLLYVGIIAINGDRAAEDPTATALLQFCVTFILSWKLWGELTLIVSWFETDDIVQRICVLLFMTCLTGYTINITHAFNVGGESTYTQLIAFYLAERIFQAIYFVFVAYLLPMIRGMLICSIFAILIPAALWVGSIHLEEPSRLAFVWVAIPLELFGPGLIVFIVRHSSRWEGGLGAKLGKHLQFYPAINIEHKTERTNAFVAIVFGYSVVALLYQNRVPNGINSFFGKAILGLAQAFVMQFLYFEIDSRNIFTHAIRRHHVSFIVWSFLHLPFVMSYILASGALSKLVIAHDCANADPDWLAEANALKSEEEIPIGLRWFYCTGLGIALASMGGIAIAHDHKELRGQRITKRYRLLLRFTVAVILTCLPLASRLDSLQLITTSTGLILFVLIADLYGATCIHDEFWWETRQYKYAAECHLRKKDVEAVKSGVLANVEEIAMKHIGDKGVLDV